MWDRNTQGGILMKDIASILSKVDAEEMLTNAVTLLNIDNQSKVFYELIAKANELSRKEYGDKGYIFAQIGLNSEPCSGNCGLR